MGAVFVDLDRTLLRRASGPVLNRALVAAGVVAAQRSVPGDGLLYGFYDRFGETLVAMGLARGAARVARGWSQEAVRTAGTLAVPELTGLMAPFAAGRLAAFRQAGHQLVLATTTPSDMIESFARSLGFDDVIATRYETRDGHYTGRLEGGFVWGIGKLQAARRWARQHDVDLGACHVCSDSFYDLPLLSSVGHPHAVNPDPRLALVAAARRWPTEYWDRPPGVPSLLGWEPYHVLKPFVRPEMFPYARFDVRGVRHIPKEGPVLLASNHRSYFDVVALAIVAAKVGRPVRFLAKRELFDAPLIGWVARAIGGIPVDRGSGSDRPLQEAEAALAAGDVVIVLPQGTIPRGDAFFDPVLHGKTGTARLAASSGAPVVPIGIWGTEKVWARSSRLPDVIGGLRHPPKVTVRIGAPAQLGLSDAVADTTALMADIGSLLPAAARAAHRPSPEELARTFPPGSKPQARQNGGPAKGGAADTSAQTGGNGDGRVHRGSAGGGTHPVRP